MFNLKSVMFTHERLSKRRSAGILADSYKKEPNVEILNSIAEAVGNTPMIRLSRINKYPNHTLLAKCEFMNPGGSVKDRIAFYMVEQAELEGDLKPGQLIVEATGGNTGIGLALAAKLTGHKLVTVMTEKVGKEKIHMMQVLGAETIVVPGGKLIDDPAHFINQGRQIAKERNAWYVDQFENKHNLDAHYKFTGPEIWKQTDGTIDALVAGIGTGGTLCGAGRYLKEQKPSLKLVLADPIGSMLSDWHNGTEPHPAPYLVEGIGGDFVAGNVNMSMIDHSIAVTDKMSIDTAHDLLEKEAIFAGSSSGCVLAAAMKYCEQSNQKGLTVVAVLPDTGRLYMDTIFEEQWLLARVKG
jgi:cystathionine beta-synthase